MSCSIKERAEKFVLEDVGSEEVVFREGRQYNFLYADGNKIIERKGLTMQESLG